MDQESLIKKARSGVLRQLTYRDRSVREVKDYLDRKNYPEDIKDKIVKEMIGHGYLDDKRFAANFVSYRKTGGYGLLKVRYELQQKGISRPIIDELIDERFDREEDLEKVREILRKRVPLKEDIDQRWINRQIAFLKRRGFQDNLILEVIKDYSLFE